MTRVTAGAPATCHRRPARRRSGWDDRSWAPTSFGALLKTPVTFHAVIFTIRWWQCNSGQRPSHQMGFGPADDSLRPKDFVMLKDSSKLLAPRFHLHTCQQSSSVQPRTAALYLGKKGFFNNTSPPSLGHGHQEARTVR